MAFFIFLFKWSWNVTFWSNVTPRCAFPQNFHSRKLGEITVFYAVRVIRVIVVEKVIFIDELIDTVRISFSKNLEQMSRIDTGRWLFTIYLEFFLCTGIMLPFFQSSGKTPCWRQFLYVIDRGLVIAKLHNFSIRIEIPSWSWALCEFNPLIHFKIFQQSILKPLDLFCI